MTDYSNGRQDAFRPAAQQVIPSDEDFIILLDYYASAQRKEFANLMRIRSDGSVAWRIEAPNSGDIFVAIELRNGLLLGSTWGGYKLTIDPSSGKVIQSDFTK